jgi:prepilin signal peptidase PulO-like enzyme (type II secretory pathway)
MESIILGIILSGILGSLIGSFLNVVILRYNTGMFKKSRSECFSCGKTLKSTELIPILSFIYLKGRCSECKCKISWQYPIVEALTAFLFILTYLSFFTPTLIGIAFSVYVLIIISLLIIITVYDLRLMIIPDGIVYAFSIIGLIKIFTIHGFAAFMYPNILDLLAGPILFLPFFLFWFLSKGQWMGFGDAKLALGIGLNLGLVGGLSAIIIGFWAGAIVSIIHIILTKLPLSLGLKKITIKSEIPFAPYLIFGTILVLFWNVDVLGLGQLLGL